MASLEVLPLEIHESIFAYLLPHQHHKELPTLDHDYRYEKARPDIYNVRLTSRRLRAAAFQAFVWILEDLPTKFQEKTLGNLAALLELPEISSRLTYLSLLPYHLFTNETYSYNVYIIAHYSKAEFHARCAWLRDTLPETLVATIRKAPRLRHLVCVIAPLRIDFEDAEEPTYVGATSSEATDPMHIVQNALASTQLSERLESMYLFYNPWAGGAEGLVPEGLDPLGYTNVRHLTLAPRTRRVSDFRIQAPYLTSLCLVLDRRCKEDLSALSTQGVCFPELCPSLRTYVIRGDEIKEDFPGQVVALPTQLLVQFLAPIFERGLTPSTVSLEHIECSRKDDVAYIPDFQGNGRIGLLVFKNFYYRLPKIGKRRFGTLRDNGRAVEHDWMPYEALLARSDSSRIE